MKRQMVFLCVVLGLAGVAGAATNVYGLFVGVDFSGEDGSMRLRGDLGAVKILDAFSENVANFKGVALIGGTIYKQDLWEAVFPAFYDEIKEGDIFVVYMHSHGSQGIYVGPETDFNDEYIFLYGDHSVRWHDDDLYELVGEMRRYNICTWVLIDACHSGGFWGDHCPTDLGDLEKLNNIGLLAAAPEDENAHYLKLVGHIGIFTYILETALTKPSGSSYICADSNHDNQLTWDELTDYVQSDFLAGDYVGEEVGLVGSGEPILFTLDMWNPVAFTTPDFSSNVSLTISPPNDS